MVSALPPGQRIVFVLECYLDDSDNSQGPTMGVGGFVASEAAWRDFEAEADPYLLRWGVNVLRGKDFNNGHNDFKDWHADKEAKAEFVRGLFQLSRKYILNGVCSTVSKKFFKKLRAQNPAFTNISPLGIAFASAVFSSVMKDQIGGGPGKGMPVSFVVELGNKNNANLVRYYAWLNKIWNAENCPLGELRFVDKHHCRAVQLADFLAFHGRREADRWDRSGYKDRDLEGHAMSIMDGLVRIRYNRLFDDRLGARWGNAQFVIDQLNSMIVPKDGLR